MKKLSNSAWLALLGLGVLTFAQACSACSYTVAVEAPEFVKLNDDDDDDDEIFDNQDVAPGDAEDDLWRIWITNSGGPGTEVRLTLPENFKLWRTCWKGVATEITERAWAYGAIPESIYLEGVSKTGANGADIKARVYDVASGQPVGPECTTLVTVIYVNFTIWHGQDGWLLWEGKESLPPPQHADDKYGATTVANLNDTDGDGRPDNQEDSTGVRRAQTVLWAAAAQGATSLTVGDESGYQEGDNVAISSGSAGELRTVLGVSEHTITLAAGLSRAYANGSSVYHPGRDEVDLMKLNLWRPDPDVGGSVDLQVYSGDVKIWNQSTKETEVVLTNGVKTFAPNELPKTVWIEARAASTIRGIVIVLWYKGLTDVVRATAVWVIKTNRPAGEGLNPWCTTQPTDGWANNPVVDSPGGVAGQLPNLDDTALATKINTTYKAANGSRYGHGIHSSPAGPDTKIGGKILWEFEVAPHGAEGLGVTFDVTRQAKVRIYDIICGGSAVWPLDDENADFPWEESPPKDIEEANDDGETGDEDNVPANSLLYVFDSTGRLRPSQELGFCVFRGTFKEWVRVKLDNGTFANQNNAPAEGSRASDKQDWHCLMYAKRDSSDKFVEDNTSPSACAPLLLENKGALDVTVNAANAVTEGWQVQFDQAGNQWIVTGNEGSGGTLTLQTDQTWQGTGSKDGNTRVTLKITSTGGGFINNDKFLFSTFKSAATAGKVNETTSGEANVTDGP